LFLQVFICGVIYCHSSHLLPICCSYCCSHLLFPFVAHLLFPFVVPICCSHLLLSFVVPVCDSYLLCLFVVPICCSYLLFPFVIPICDSHLLFSFVILICDSHLLFLFFLFVVPVQARRPRSVGVSGSFDKWAVRRPMTWDPSLQAFVLNLALPPGKHFYKIVVDGVWMLNSNHPTETDVSGNVNNILVCGV